MNFFKEKGAAAVARITESTWLILLSLLIFGILLKLVYIFAAPIWRVDLYYQIQSAKTILDGGVLFKDFGTSHPAGIVFLHWSLMKLFGYQNIPISLKVAAFISQTGAAYFLYKIVQKGYNSFIAYFTALIFIVSISINWQLWPANIMFFYLFPVMAGIYVVYKNAENQKLLPYFISGILFSISTMICTNTVFFNLLIPLISLYLTLTFKKFFYHSAIGFAGFMIPAAFNFGYFIYHNAMADYYLWTVVWSSIYTGYKPFYMRFVGTFQGMGKTWEWIPLYIYSFYGIFIVLKQKNYRTDIKYFLALAVLILSVISRLAMLRSPVRYSFYLLPGFIIFLPVIIENYNSIKNTFIKKYMPLFTGVFLVVVFCFTNITAYSYSKGIIDYGRKNLHEWVKKNTNSDDSIFVWYEGYEVYFYTGRKMATSIFSTSEFLDPVILWEENNYRNIDLFWGRFIEEFKRDKPKLLIDLHPDFWLKNNWERKGEMKRYFDIFKEYLDRNYSQETVVDGAKIWKRKD